MPFMVIIVIACFILGLMTLNHFLPLLLNLGVTPKGSFGWPLIGETLAFLKPHPSNSLGSFLQHHCSRYGMVFKTHLFFCPTIVSCDSELNYYILQNEGKLFETSYPKPIHGILGNLSMLVAVGDTHKRLRNLALSLVNVTKSKPNFLTDIQDNALYVLHSWAHKKQVTFSQEARKFTFNVIVKQVLGLRPDEPRTTKILQDFQTFMKGLISLPIYIPGTSYARAVQARRRICSSVKAIIEERKARKKIESNNIDNLCGSDDFLETLVCVNTLSEDEKVSFVLDALLGGYETTSLLMSMVVYFLGQSPIALNHLKMEHQRIRNMKQKHEYLNWDDYKKMGFTQQVINEALRCGNIVKFVHRKTLKDVQFKGYVIPSGWKVLPVFTAVHLDSSLHTKAFQFNPSRWKNLVTKKQSRQDQTSKVFTPFGGGLRCCPGSELAKIEVSFFLHHLVQNFRWKIKENEKSMAYPYVEFEKGLIMNLDQIDK